MEIITCKEAKAQGLKRYFTGKSCPHGHIAERQCSSGACLACHAAASRAYREADPEKVAAIKKACCEKNAEKIAAYNKAYQAANAEKIAARSKAYREADPEKVAAWLIAWRKANREEIAAYGKAYYAANRAKASARVKAYLQNNLGARTKNALRVRTHDAIRAAGATKSARTVELLGASIEEVRAHLEAQFKLGMNWDNWARDGWHIDHIKPCASFDLTDPEQQKACFHYSNLQPLWAKDNQSKSDRLDWVPAEA